MQIVVPNLGHGDCTGIFKHDECLIVDCGAGAPKKYEMNVRVIGRSLGFKRKKSAILSHYHWDHYNLFPRISPAPFDELFLPALPPKTATGDAILNFLSLASVTGYKYYPFLPRFLKMAKAVHPCMKNSIFRTLGFQWEVLWPDYGIIDKVYRQELAWLGREINRIKKKLEEDKRAEFERVYRRLSWACQEGDRLENLKETPYGEETCTRTGRNASFEIEGALGGVEKVFKDVANGSSLVARTINGGFLFTGDVESDILNSYLTLNDAEYFLAKAPHHGSHYGRGMQNLKTNILILSRKHEDKVRNEFYTEVNWGMLIDTARQGTCVINAPTSPPFQVFVVSKS